MPIKKAEVEVTVYVNVEYDESKFTPEFMETFKRYFFDAETVEEHIKHLAREEACGALSFDPFVEGYGPLKDMGIKMEIEDYDEDIMKISEVEVEDASA